MDKKKLESRIARLEKLMKNEAVANVNVDHIITEVNDLKDRMAKLAIDIEDALYAIDEAAKKSENDEVKEAAKSLKDLRKVGEDLDKVSNDIQKVAIVDQLAKIKEALNKPAEVKKESKRLYNKRMNDGMTTDPLAEEVYTAANNIERECQALAVKLKSSEIISLPEIENALSLCNDNFPGTWADRFDRILSRR